MKTKRLIAVLMMLVLVLLAASCGTGVPAADETTAAPSTAENGTETDKTDPVSDKNDNETTSDTAKKSLVVYFSATGTTKAAAERVARIADADIYEIVPADPYTSDDLNYNNDDCRANKEMNDKSARPAISGELPDISGYDTVYIGFPIWWGTMPRIINTFLDGVDLSGKKIMPFCTSGSSGISAAVTDIKEAAPNADVRDGLRISGSDDTQISDWTDGSK